MSFSALDTSSFAGFALVGRPSTVGALPSWRYEFMCVFPSFSFRAAVRVFCLWILLFQLADSLFQLANVRSRERESRCWTGLVESYNSYQTQPTYGLAVALLALQKLAESVNPSGCRWAAAGIWVGLFAGPCAVLLPCPL